MSASWSFRLLRSPPHSRQLEQIGEYWVDRVTEYAEFKHAERLQEKITRPTERSNAEKPQD